MNVHTHLVNISVYVITAHTQQKEIIFHLSKLVERKDYTPTHPQSQKWTSYNNFIFKVFLK